jgi:AbrB family looped-hinge helix DNA binding protein
VIARISTRGRVVLPQAIRKRMNLRAGDNLETRIEGERIVLIPKKVPKKKRSRKGRIIKDPLTGLPVLTAGKNAPRLTSEQVAEMLADFP